MRGIIQFILRYNGFFLFLILEVICFFLIIRFNESQNRIYFSSANFFTGLAYDKYYNFKQYVNLSGVADSLAKENAIIYEQLERSKFNNKVLIDTALAKNIIQKYTYTPARVINNTTQLHNNYITLDRGAKHGIKPHSGVIGENGLVGIITNTSKYYSLAISLLHRQTKISVKIRRNNELGSLVWAGTDARFMSLEAVPNYVPIVEGDTIETSGYSSIFPEGLTIGLIDTFWINPGSSFYHIDVRLNNNLRNIQYTQIVRNLFQEEQMTLEEQGKNE